MNIYLIGTGMDGDNTLTKEAREATERSDVLVGAARMTEPFQKLGKPVFVSWRYEEITAFLNDCPYDSAAVLMSGDCGFFSGAEKLSAMLSGHETSIIPGIASPVYLAARIKKPWKDMRFVDLHGKSANVVRNVCRSEYCFFLLGGETGAEDICRRLVSYGMGDIKVFVGENMGRENERIVSGTAEELSCQSFEKLSVMITENPGFEKGVRYGIPDDRFLRSDIPMTKSEIRAVVMSKLSPGESSAVWDIGCGTGSVSVECALCCTNGTVYSVDKKPEALELTVRNSVLFRCDNIVPVGGDIRDRIGDLPRPDAVFIGGASGRTDDIVSAAAADGNTPAIVITAVSLETLSEAVSALEKNGFYANVTEIAVTRTKRLGTHTMLSALNPVFIIEGIK